MTMTTPLADAASTAPPLPPEPHPADPSAPRHFDFVDSLRGLAILGVMMVHVTLVCRDFHGRLRGAAMQGRFGVQLFFIVSAFTLFWSLRSRRSQDRRPMLAFYARRLFRIAPLFYVAIAFYMVWPNFTRAVSAPDGVRWPHVVSTLLFVHGWYPTTINTVVPGGWSIGAEVMFYLCIPVLFARVRTLNGALWLSVVAAVLVGRFSGPVETHIAAHFPASYAEVVHNFVYYSFPSQFPVFCVGMVLYFLLAEPAGSPNGRVGGWLLATAAFALLIAPLGVDALPCVAFVMLAVGLARKPVWVLVNPVTRFIGMVSFSGYIWHFWFLEHLTKPTLGALSKHMGPTLQFCGLYLVVVVATMPAATLSYYLIEQPGQNLGRWLINTMGWGKGAGRPRGAVQPVQPAEIAVAP